MLDGSTTDLLMEVELNVITTAECQTKANTPTDVSKIMCTLTPTKDTCQVNALVPYVYLVGGKGRCVSGHDYLW